MAITPVILAGGSGERLWPLSKSDYPKQFVCLHGVKTSLFQDCVNRVKGRAGFAVPIILTNHEHRFIVAEQLRQIGVENASIIIEPVARNTAAAITIAALHAAAPPADAKNFFRACRARMTASSYAELLVCIKRLNAGELTLDAVLEEARLLFGPLGGDLAEQFALLVLAS